MKSGEDDLEQRRERFVTVDHGVEPERSVVKSRELGWIHLQEHFEGVHGGCSEEHVPKSR